MVTLCIAAILRLGLGVDFDFPIFSGTRRPTAGQRSETGTPPLLFGNTMGYEWDAINISRHADNSHRIPSFSNRLEL